VTKKVQITGEINQESAVGVQVYRILREQIIHSVLLPGSRLSETDVSRSLSISRQPVREAFIKLSDEGLVVVLPQRGTIVTKISTAAVENAQFVREAVEVGIVSILAEKNDPVLVDELNQLIGLQRKAQPDELKFMELDDQFHRALALAAGKSLAWNVVDSLKAQMDRVRSISFIQYPFERLIQQHEAVVIAISKGDTTGAVNCIRIHLREILRDLPGILSKRQEMFDE